MTKNEKILSRFMRVLRCVKCRKSGSRKSKTCWTLSLFSGWRFYRIIIT